FAALPAHSIRDPAEKDRPRTPRGFRIAMCQPRATRPPHALWPEHSWSFEPRRRRDVPLPADVRSNGCRESLSLPSEIHFYVRTSTGCILSINSPAEFGL